MSISWDPSSSLWEIMNDDSTYTNEINSFDKPSPKGPSATSHSGLSSRTFTKSTPSPGSKRTHLDIDEAEFSKVLDQAQVTDAFALDSLGGDQDSGLSFANPQSDRIDLLSSGLSLNPEPFQFSAPQSELRSRNIGDSSTSSQVTTEEPEESSKKPDLNVDNLKEFRRDFKRRKSRPPKRKEERSYFRCGLNRLTAIRQELSNQTKKKPKSEATLLRELKEFREVFEDSEGRPPKLQEELTHLCVSRPTIDSLRRKTKKKPKSEATLLSDLTKFRKDFEEREGRPPQTTEERTYMRCSRATILTLRKQLPKPRKVHKKKRTR